MIYDVNGPHPFSIERLAVMAAWIAFCFIAPYFLGLFLQWMK